MIESPVLQRWSREERAAARQESVLELLEARFGGIPPDVSASVRVVADHARLKQLLLAAHSAATLDDFRAALTQ